MKATFLVEKEIQARVKGGELALISPGEVVSLESEKAEALIKAGKLKLVQSEPADIEEYCKLCSQALERINNIYYPRSVGWIDWLKNHKPNLWRELEDAEKDLERPIDRRISLSEFARLVDYWETLYRQAIELFLRTRQERARLWLKNTL